MNYLYNFDSAKVRNIFWKNKKMTQNFLRHFFVGRTGLEPVTSAV